MPPNSTPHLQVGGRLRHFVTTWSYAPKWIQNTMFFYGLNVRFRHNQKGPTLHHTSLAPSSSPTTLPLMQDFLDRARLSRQSQVGPCLPGLRDRQCVRRTTSHLRSETTKLLIGPTEDALHRAPTTSTTIVPGGLDDLLRHQRCLPSSLPLHLSTRPYLLFKILGQTYQFRVLPFGLNTAPLTFTSVMAPI